MANGNHQELSINDKEDFKWISGPYFSGLYALIDSNRSYLNQGITWSIGILTAVIIFGLTYIAPLQEIRDASGIVTGRSFLAIFQNITDADVLVLAAVLSLAFAFIANFLSRSIKGYLNLMRYAALYSRCVRLASGAVPVTSSEIKELKSQIKQYDDDFCPPLTLSAVLRKMITELGYGLFFVILIFADIVVTIAWVCANTTISGLVFLAILALGPAWLIAELVLLRRSSYFRYGDHPPISWREAIQRK